MDPEASELVLPSDPVKVGTAAEFTVCTKDQDGKPVFVEGMKVRRGGRGTHHIQCPQMTSRIVGTTVGWALLLMPFLEIAVNNWRPLGIAWDY